MLQTHRSTSITRILLRMAAPVAAGAASFLPWLTVGVVTRTRHWNAYHMGSLAWLWMAFDAAAIVLPVVSSRRKTPIWLTWAWAMLGALSLGVAISGFVLASVSARVSTILSAPNPLSVSYGLDVFLAACVLWCAVGWGPWPQPAPK